MREDRDLHEFEELHHYGVLFYELPSNLLDLREFSTLLVFLIFLLGFLLDLHSLHHVTLVLILLEFISKTSLPDVLNGLPSLLLECDAVLADQVNEVNASLHYLVLLAKYQANVLFKSREIGLSVSLDDVVQSADEEVNALKRQIGLDRFEVQAQESAEEMHQAPH